MLASSMTVRKRPEIAFPLSATKRFVFDKPIPDGLFTTACGCGTITLMAGEKKEQHPEVSVSLRPGAVIAPGSSSEPADAVSSTEVAETSPTPQIQPTGLPRVE